MRDRDRPLWSLSAGELATAYAGGLSPRRVIDATLARIREVNPKLNAIVTLDEAGASRAAAESARRWQDGKPSSPLDGVPVTINGRRVACHLGQSRLQRLFA
jgi:aspartyl-tRNA(Asn)/glutamyl-tRNA(Gln) amidotransferase subunit A